ncbi:Concanavalin A-like protein lectin/glucanase, subgroup [Cinnamomum micranthum f. kanehirae]|uniref:non-specific serine/threonine protein kinase n=1 Tax=Cinnamomum micranthum f. kanehirae TaxID=337451 RepID=A0A443NJ28_9MAGN|nr:Concanavalin A-like protein lectin/glucanase, subgroup [Cinnamomum micranthum f. kanehirae]
MSLVKAITKIEREFSSYFQEVATWYTEGRTEREMGNFWIAQFDSSSSSSPSSTRPSSPGITKSTSNEGTHSGTGSAFSSRLDEVSPNGQILPITPTLKIFSFAELKKATSKFSPDTLLGEGGFGRVFKGWINEKTFAPTKAGRGMAIAVKKLNPESRQGHEEWQSEVNILGSLSHPNIVRLLGHCEEDKELLLVYEFMPRGSLENHLFRRGSALQSLSWSIRLKIAIGAARGIAFLHCSERKIIYRSVKPSDILLDLNYNAKISDFGFARNGRQGEDSHVSTRVMGTGTYGYAAPEYVATGHLYVKSDVYSFGVVLLEMLSGMRPIDMNRPSGRVSLVDWAKPYLSDPRKVLSRVMDQRLEGQYPSKGAVQAAQLILKCLGSDPGRRPSMSEVIAIGAARAIAFLHCSERKIISRDVKPSNILLDSNYDAKISNFGLAKNGPVGENSHVSTRVMGTYGYAAPEYVATGHLYVKSDVYGFGVVLLEMLSGMRAIDTNRPSGQRNLVRWAKPYLYERRKLLSHVMDQRLEGQYPSKGAVQAAQLILKCVQSEPRRRPSMSEVKVVCINLCNLIIDEGRIEREMGNDWKPRFDSSSSSPSSTRPSTPGITKSTSNEGTHSGTGSAFSSRLVEVSPNGQILPITPTLKIFSFAELKKATSKFSPDTFLGEGVFGKVFKGWIDEKTFAPAKAGSGMAIAVKKLYADSIHVRKGWQSEVNILGSLSHPNIVRILGHCEEDKELLLVYEFMPRGSLENHLFSRGSAFQALSWSIRIKIALGVARGLAFLHCSERKIIHRNVTPYNNYNAKISAFGLARNGPQGETSHVSTLVVGTVGHADPEYVATGHLYVKSNVYSFGVVLLEMLSGMRAFDAERPSGQENLVDWAKPYLSYQRKVSRLMDWRLEGYYPYKGVAQIAQLILKCVGSEPRRRPSMSEVVETLEQIQAIKHKPQEQSSTTEREMGNFWIAQFDSSSSSSPSSTRPSSPGITKSTSNEGMHSGTATAFSSRLDEVSPNGQILPITPTLKIFSFAELKKATSKFSPDTLLGEGVFGKVFKGWIDEKTFAPTKAGSGMAVAVKKLNSDDFQGHEEWQSEVNILGSLSHPNIVRLLGYCWEDKERLLVYEFMPRGSLSNHLFSRGSAFQSLSWSIRLKIAIGAARAIAFLHCSERKIISRDVKPSNILLDSNYDAKISNFGLAKNGPVGENSHVSTRVMGTYGYAAPEYVATGHLYVKSDVYGFGVVLLEMLSGMRAIDTNRPSGQRNLVRWAKPYLYERRKLLSHVMDQRLEGQYPSKGAVQAAQLILKCVQSEPRRRPSMSEVRDFFFIFKKVVCINLCNLIIDEGRIEREMGNDWKPRFDSSSSSPSSTRPSTPGITKSTSNEGTHSGTGKLKKATSKFSPDTFLGEGVFGKVFKGWIDEKTFAPAKAGSGMAIAVKKLYADSIHVRKGWQSEVNILGSLSHPNIVRILGHCEEDKELLLVYEFMPRGSLENHLFRGSAFQALSWSIRIKIALGVARGLAFLHCSERKIIHRNVTPYNNYNAKISAFGLARNGPQGETSHVSTLVVGTVGHADPEYVATVLCMVGCCLWFLFIQKGSLFPIFSHPPPSSNVTKMPSYSNNSKEEKPSDWMSDVYSFGVVLLEMLSGMRAFDAERPSGQQNLVDWAKPYLSDQRKVSRLMDRRLEGYYPYKGVAQIAQLILKCVGSEPRRRPSMSEVVETLKQIQAIKHKPQEQSSTTEREMGNFWIAQFDSSSSSSPSSTRPSSPGITKSTSNEGTHSGTGSAFSSRLDEVSPNGQILPITPTLKIFSFAELKKATSKFSPDTLLGEGGFGRVFKGWINEKTFAPTKAGRGMAIAVKKLNPESLQGHEEWQSEVNILGSLSHPNIVRLLGHCEEDNELLLVYEFMPRGSLENHLFRRGSPLQSLSWSIRLKIAIGAARGIAFLHCSERKIIYRSVKPSDILLDLNYNAKISDFGLARNGPQGEDSHVFTCVRGTYNNVAPEYLATGHLYVNSDVYSFGVVLLEMLSGMRAMDKCRPSGQHNLVEWAKPYLSHPRKVLSRVMDQRLEGQYPSKGAVQAAQLILKCLGSDPRRRPSMSEVVETLEQIQAIKA